MVEPLLSGIVLGLIPVTLLGLFVTAYLQYRRGDRVTSEFQNSKTSFVTVTFEAIELGKNIY